MDHLTLSNDRLQCYRVTSEWTRELNVIYGCYVDVRACVRFVPTVCAFVVIIDHCGDGFFPCVHSPTVYYWSSVTYSYWIYVTRSLADVYNILRCLSYSPPNQFVKKILALVQWGLTASVFPMNLLRGTWNLRFMSTKSLQRWIWFPHTQQRRRVCPSLKVICGDGNDSVKYEGSR